MISAQRLAQIREAFVRDSGEPPSPAQLQGLVQQAVDEELLEREARWLALDLGDRGIRQRLVSKMRAVSRDQALGEAELYRQALDLGLDDDVAVRQHLRQKMRLLLQEDPAGRPPTDAELAACLQRNRERFLQPATVDFTQVFVRAAVDPDHLAERAAAMASGSARSACRRRKAPGCRIPSPSPPAGRGSTGARSLRHFGGQSSPTRSWHCRPALGRPRSPPRSGSTSSGSMRGTPGGRRRSISVRGQLVQILYEERSAARLAAGLDRLRRLYQIRVEWPQKVAAVGAPATEARR